MNCNDNGFSSMKLNERRCKPCEGKTEALTPEQAKAMLGEVNSRWKLNTESNEISAGFDFKNYYQTTAFVNAVAWIAHNEDHHPDIEFSYRHCEVRYTTHAIGGLSENDFICAAKIDSLIE